jgi:glycosyltransferase involved in cell wall biosynthesis
MKKISVIICTYNREKYLYNALKSIAEQDYSQKLYEIVLINNNSTDNTEDICRQFQHDFPDVSFRYVVENQQGLSYARNRGIDESNGEILIYVDDDATVFSGYLRAYDDFFQNHPDAIAGGGPIYPVFEIPEPKWMSPIMKSLLGGYLYFGNKIKTFQNGKYPGGGNAAYRKKDLAQFGYFNTELGRKGNGLLGSEEKDMFDRFRRAERSFYYIPNAAIHHYIPESKLSKEHFRELSYSIGIGEKKRTLSVSGANYRKRLFAEGIKWGASLVIFLGYLSTFRPRKGFKYLQFRWYVSKGLLSTL